MCVCDAVCAGLGMGGVSLGCTVEKKIFKLLLFYSIQSPYSGSIPGHTAAQHYDNGSIMLKYLLIVLFQNLTLHGKICYLFGRIETEPKQVNKNKF